MKGVAERKFYCNEMCCVVSHIRTGSLKGWGVLGCVWDAKIICIATTEHEVGISIGMTERVQEKVWLRSMMLDMGI